MLVLTLNTHTHTKIELSKEDRTIRDENGSKMGMRRTKKRKNHQENHFQFPDADEGLCWGGSEDFSDDDERKEGKSFL